jgi:hypothetical protein
MFLLSAESLTRAITHPKKTGTTETDKEDFTTMTDKNYNELLRKRVLQENREFNEELEKLPAHEALSRAYEKVIKEDLVCSISEGNLTNTEARALLRLKHPLDDLYSEWLHNDMSYNDMLRATIKDRATSAVREMKSQALDDR